MSQAELADALGVHQQTIQKIEKGTRSLKYNEAAQMANALKVDMAAFKRSPQRVLAEMALNKCLERLEKAWLSTSSVAAESASALVQGAFELRVDEVRPEQHQVPNRSAIHVLEHHWLQVVGASGWLEKFNDVFAANLREEAEQYGVRNIPEGATADEILRAVAELKIFYPDSEVRRMDADS